jgi:chromosome segregation ATPase
MGLQTITALEADVASLRKDVSEREAAIEDRDRHAAELKRKLQELEKFKFVLEYKIGELREQVDPKDVALAEMQDQIKARPKTRKPETLQPQPRKSLSPAISKAAGFKCGTELRTLGAHLKRSKFEAADDPAMHKP